MDRLLMRDVRLRAWYSSLRQEGIVSTHVGETFF